MKLHNKTLKNFCIGAILILTIASCKKEEQHTTNQVFELNNKAFVQLFNGLVGSNRNYLYADNIPLNGATIGTNAIFPTTTASTTVLDPGMRNFEFKDTLPTTAQVPLSFSEQLVAQKSYTIFTYDTITQPKKVTVENIITIPSDTTARVRLANLLYIKTGPANVDVVSKTRNVKVFSNVGFGQVTDFVPYPSNYLDTLYIIKTGTTDTLGTMYGTFGSTAKSSYTAALRGSASSKTTAWGISSWVHRY